MELPKFRYHPDPIATGAIERSGILCECCGRKSGFRYALSVYSAEEVSDVCPWCIQDGSAAKKFEAIFCDDYPLIEAGLPEELVQEVSQRTPGFESWQQEVWLSHCGDACAFIGDATKEDVLALAEGVGRVEDQNLWKPEDFRKLAEYYEPKGSPALYKFKCLHCGEILYGIDMC